MLRCRSIRITLTFVTWSSFCVVHSFLVNFGGGLFLFSSCDKIKTSGGWTMLAYLFPCLIYPCLLLGLLTCLLTYLLAFSLSGFFAFLLSCFLAFLISCLLNTCYHLLGNLLLTRVVGWDVLLHIKVSSAQLSWSWDWAWQQLKMVQGTFEVWSKLGQ